MLLLDEPTSALDPEMRDEVMTVIRDLAAGGMTMLVVTHEMQFAHDIASRVWVIDRGTIAEDGPPAPSWRTRRARSRRSSSAGCAASRNVAGCDSRRGSCENAPVTIPRAVASGAAGADAPDDHVRSRRVAWIAGVLAAGYLLALFVVTPVPSGIVSLFGGARGGVARYGGLVARWEPPPDLDLAALELRFRARDVGAVLRRDGAAVLVEVPGVRENEAAEVVAMIGAAAGSSSAR